MTLKELIKTLENRRKGLAYRMWRQASLIGLTMGKEFPTTVEKAVPELFPPKQTHKMPEWLKAKYEKQKEKQGIIF